MTGLVGGTLPSTFVPGPPVTDGARKQRHRLRKRCTTSHSFLRAALLGPLLLSLAACPRNLRSSDPQNWVELETEYFLLRTDLPLEDARKAARDLELLRAALLAAGWHGDRPPIARIRVLALASSRELHEFLPESMEGLTSETPTGRLIIVNGDSDLLGSQVVKHEISHALTHDYLITSPRWVQEGIACYLETLELDRERGLMVRGSSHWSRRGFVGRNQSPQWKSRLMNVGPEFWYLTGDQQYAFETYSWALVHWLVDTRPQQFAAFLAGLSRGELMWAAFSAAFPGLTEAEIATGMREYLIHLRTVGLTTLPLPAWSGPVEVRPIAPAEVHMIRAALFYLVAGEERWRKTQEEHALALAEDPSHPIALALSRDGDPQRAIDAHPDDWRAWMYWHEKHPGDVAAVRKAAQLAPNEPAVLIALAQIEQDEGKSQQAIEHAEHAARIAPGQPRVLDTLAQIYAHNRRCDDARQAEERAIGAVSEAADRQMPLSLVDRLDKIVSGCKGASTR